MRQKKTPTDVAPINPVIRIVNFNLEQVSLVVAKNLFDDYPNNTMNWYADVLGVSVRTLFRWEKLHGLIIPKKGGGRNASPEVMIKILEGLGYSVSK